MRARARCAHDGADSNVVPITADPVRQARALLANGREEFQEAMQRLEESRAARVPLASRFERIQQLSDEVFDDLPHEARASRRAALPENVVPITTDPFRVAVNELRAHCARLEASVAEYREQQRAKSAAAAAEEALPPRLTELEPLNARQIAWVRDRLRHAVNNVYARELGVPPAVIWAEIGGLAEDEQAPGPNYEVPRAAN